MVFEKYVLREILGELVKFKMWTLKIIETLNGKTIMSSSNMLQRREEKQNHSKTNELIIITSCRQ